jgi:hypothetical protein
MAAILPYRLPHLASVHRSRVDIPMMMIPSGTLGLAGDIVLRSTCTNGRPDTVLAGVQHAGETGTSPPEMNIRTLGQEVQCPDRFQSRRARLSNPDAVCSSVLATALA